MERTTAKMHWEKKNSNNKESRHEEKTQKERTNYEESKENEKIEVKFFGTETMGSRQKKQDFFKEKVDNKEK